MKKINIVLTFLLFSSIVFAQDSSEDKFKDANLSLEEKKYEQALVIWEELLEQDPENANLNYKVGLCYENLPIEKHRALPFLEKASLKMTKNYDIFSSSETNAPVEVLYHLAYAYHLDGQLDKATATYQKFLKEASKKHFLAELAEKGIKDCETAREFMNNKLDIEIQNLGDQVNSKYHEHSPVVSLDENVIFFTSRRLRDDSSNAEFIDENSGKFFEDIYVSYKNENGTWGQPELLSFSRKDGHDATVSLHPNGQSLYIYRDDFGNGTLYESKLVDEIWTLPVMMESNINTPKSFEPHLSVSNDGKTLYFASDRKGGFGGIDIYKCNKLPNGKWGLAVNLGNVINTKYDDNAPFIHPDGKTLYFTSRGHKNMGGYDIFYSTLNNDDTWSTPKNMGFPINTTDDEQTFITSPDGKRAYYSSYKDGGYGEGDIYIITLNQAEETGLTLVKGKITIPDGTDFPKDVRILLKDNETGELVAESRPLKRNGSFVFIVPPGKNYNVSYEINGKSFYEENTFVPQGTEYKVIQKEVALDPLKLDAGENGALVVKNATPSNEPRWQLRYYNSQEKISEGQTVFYLAEKGTRITHEEAIDKDGFFKYYPNENGEEYQFKVNNLSDHKLCDGGEIILVGGPEKKQIKLLPDLNCIFTEYKTGTAQVLTYSRTSTLPVGTKAVYTDRTGNELMSSTVDKSGFFQYLKLSDYQEYIVRLENQNCQDLLVLISTEDNKRFYLAPEKNNDGTCTFKSYEAEKFRYVGQEPINDGTIASFLSEEGTVLYQERVKNKEFRFHRLPFDKTYRIKLLENDQTLCKGGEIHYVRKDGSGYKLKSEEDCIYKLFDVIEPSKDKYIVGVSPTQNILNTTVQTKPNTPVSKEDKIMEKFENSLVQNTKSKEELSYKTNFEYNKNKIDVNDPKFKKMISNAVAIYKAKGVVDIAIESGASKVPTKTFANNDELARLRAYQAKDFVIEELVKAGVDKDKINTRDITYLVQGPDYKKDPFNLKLYKPFQYVKLWITNDK